MEIQIVLEKGMGECCCHGNTHWSSGRDFSTSVLSTGGNNIWKIKGLTLLTWPWHSVELPLNSSLFNGARVCLSSCSSSWFYVLILFSYPRFEAVHKFTFLSPWALPYMTELSYDSWGWKTISCKRSFLTNREIWAGLSLTESLLRT